MEGNWVKKGKGSSQGTRAKDPWARTMGWRVPLGVGVGRSRGEQREKKWWYIFPMEYYTAEIRKELLPFATTWMELESIMLSEISQAVKDKYHMISPISGT